MKYLLALAVLFTITLPGCTLDEILTELNRVQEESTIEVAQHESYLPMSVGNLWQYNDENYTVIQDTIRIEGELFYKFYSLIGGDGIQTQYLRIDNHRHLIERHPDYPDLRVLHADFNAEVGDTFSTLGDGSVNDYQIEVVAKSDSSTTFYYQNIKTDYVHYQDTFIKGFGYKGDYEYERVELY